MLQIPSKQTTLSSDIGLLMRWRKRVPLHLQAINEEGLDDDDMPWRGLRNYWYPIMPLDWLAPKEKHRPTHCRLLGNDIALFHDAKGDLAAVDAVCPHRGALLTLGWCDVFRPGTLTCRYHGWTFDGTGKCVASLTDGPDSKIPNVARVRSYPVQKKYGAIWIYPGSQPAPALEESLPHLADVMRGKWPSVRIHMIGLSTIFRLSTTTEIPFTR